MRLRGGHDRASFSRGLERSPLRSLENLVPREPSLMTFPEDTADYIYYLLSRGECHRMSRE
jgi:hypothetical protein